MYTESCSAINYEHSINNVSVVICANLRPIKFKKRSRIIPAMVIFVRICVTGTSRGVVNNMIPFFPLDNKAVKLKYFSLTLTLALALIIDTGNGRGDSSSEVNEP